MEILSTYTTKYADSKKDSDVARHNVITMLQSICKMHEKMEKTLKNKESVDTFLESCIMKMPALLKDYYALAEHAEKLKKLLDAAEHEEKKKIERAAKREAKTLPKQVQIVNNYIVYGNIQQEASGLGNIEVAKRSLVKQEKDDDPQPVDKTLKQKYKKTSIPKPVKDDIWNYYIGNDCAHIKCPCCQNKEIRMNDFVAGHVMAERNGGQAIRENLIPICNTCNCSMGSTHMIEFCEKYWGRSVVLPKNNTFTNPNRKNNNCGVKQHLHCLLIKGGDIDKKKFDTDEEALAYAKSKQYTGVSHKTDSKALYYFIDKPIEKVKFNAVNDPVHGDWGFTSWTITYHT